jgi:hypothetical protein
MNLEPFDNINKLVLYVSFYVHVYLGKRHNKVLLYRIVLHKLQLYYNSPVLHT